MQKTSSSTQTALFAFASTASAGILGTINGVRVNTRSREPTGAGSLSKTRIVSVATNSDTSLFSAGTSYANDFRVAATDPNTGIAWTTSGVDAMQGGIVDTDTNVTERATTVDVSVNYIPAAAAVTGAPSLEMMGVGDKTMWQLHNPNFSRFLVYLLRALVSLVSYLGDHRISENERNATENKIAIQNLREALYREVEPITDKVSQDDVRLTTIEKSYDSFSTRFNARLAEERGKRLADVEKRSGSEHPEIFDTQYMK